jgi:hypothetical protein
VPHCTALILPSWWTARTVRQGRATPKTGPVKTGPVTEAFQLDGGDGPG